MKSNWKWAIMFAAAVAFVGCKDKNQPTPTPTPEPEPEKEYVQLIHVDDNSLADWDAVPADQIAVAVLPENQTKVALKSVKVYADKFYIFVRAELDMEEIIDKGWVPFHVYINTDNNDATGGDGGGQFADPNEDIMLEGVVFASGEACSYGPAVFKWWGEVGGTEWAYWQENGEEHGAEEKWGAIVGEGELQGTMSQFVEDKVIELQIMRELVPTPAGWNEDEFGIGFDIQQSWNSVGILPAVDPTEDNTNGMAHKLQVKINK